MDHPFRTLIYELSLAPLLRLLQRALDLSVSAVGFLSALVLGGKSRQPRDRPRLSRSETSDVSLCAAQGESMIPITESQSTQRIQLERLLKSAVVLSWDELMSNSTLGLIDIEYQAGDDGLLDYLKIWASTIWGQWKLVCEFWMRPLWSHATGVRFASEYHSVDFARTLELVVGNESAFSVVPDLHGLIQVFPPTDVERNDAKQITMAILDNHGHLPFEKHVAA
jgi:hypothetical protein